MAGEQRATRTITIPLRVRGVWRIRLLLATLYAARWTGIIQSNEHAESIALRLAPRLVQFRIGSRGKWHQVSKG